MGNTWTVDDRQFLDGSGAPAPDLPRPARMLAEFFTQIVSQATLYDEPTTITWRRRPQHRPCAQPLYISFDETLEVVLWEYPRCHDNGAIRGWQASFWDHSGLAEPSS